MNNNEFILYAFNRMVEIARREEVDFKIYDKDYCTIIKVGKVSYMLTNQFDVCGVLNALSAITGYYEGKYYDTTRS